MSTQPIQGEGARVTGGGALVFTVMLFGFGFSLGAVVFGGDDERTEPMSIEERCGEAADEICPGSTLDYSSTQAEACRSREFERCLDSARVPTMEACREECAEIVRDLRRANDDLWERWLATCEEE